jgi:hypothetical protein
VPCGRPSTWSLAENGEPSTVAGPEIELPDVVGVHKFSLIGDVIESDEMTEFMHCDGARLG